jgi:ABC-type multidrug transport system fused ATPase/permease subunit
MFLVLLVVTLAVAVSVSMLVVRAFSQPIDKILKRIISDEISSAWLRYLRFAIVVVGVSAGVRIYELEKYISPRRYEKDAQILQLTFDRWILELYRTVIETLQGIAWMLLVFFIFALLAYVIVRFAESRRAQVTESRTP